MDDIQVDERQQQMPQVYAQGQSAEFLKYLLETQDPINELINELEGKEVILGDNNQPILQRTRTPMINDTLRNIIIGVLKTYNTRGFITTSLKSDDITRIVRNVSMSVVDTLETSNRYSSVDWSKNLEYLKNYPAFLTGTQQHILLMIENTVLATLKRSEDAITLNKVTGMHSSSEIRSDAGKQNKLLGIFNRGG